MKKNKPKYLKCYYKWLESGLPERGLCNCFPNDKIFGLVRISPLEKMELGKAGYCTIMWASDEPLNPSTESMYQFTPLRQTLVLLMAALNNEL